jgi:DNA-binding NtrC family response regulator
LLVDDDPATMAALPDALQGRLPRLRIETTTSIVDALARLDVRPYSVVLTDFRMPRMDGLSFLREVKTRHADTPVVVMTGLTDDSLAGHARAAGAFDLLPKPLDQEDLSTTLQLAVRAHALMRDIKASQQRLERYRTRFRHGRTTTATIQTGVNKSTHDLWQEAVSVRARSRTLAVESKALVDRTVQRLRESEALLLAVHEIIRRRSQERARRTLAPPTG